MINIKELRSELKDIFALRDSEITISRKKKMVIEQTTNGNTKLKRRNVIKIEIIE